MGVNILRDCVTQPDGTMFCYDRLRKKFYAFEKKEVAADMVDKGTLIQLLEKIATVNQKGDE